MKTIDEYYIASDEWEPLQDNLVIRNISDIGELHPATETISISRSNKYELDVRIGGTKARFVENRNQLQRVVGKSYPGSQVIGSTATGEVIILENAVQGEYSVRGDGKLEGTAFVGIIHVDYKREEQVTRKTIWCLNGPSSFLPPRATEWERTEELKKEQKRLNQDESELAITKKGRSRSTAFNHWLIKCNQFEFRFCFVPKDLGPAWSQNCRLDFNLPQPVLDSEEGQEAVLEALSFIIGKRLIRVATTDYAIDGYPLKESLFRA